MSAIDWSVPVDLHDDQVAVVMYATISNLCMAMSRFLATLKKRVNMGRHVKTRKTRKASSLADLTDDEISGAIVPTCINMFSILTPLFVGVDPQIRDSRRTYLNLWYVV
jgi:hypothetical protein